MQKKENKERLIETVLNRAVEEVIVKDHLAEALGHGKKLRVKLGIDPTAPALHLGHSVVLRKLRQFQDLGHKIVFIIGDFTARIGDPSGRNVTRKPLSEKDIKTNMRGYLGEASKIINIEKTEVRRNSEWLEKGGLKNILSIAQSATVQQVLKRDDFKKRLDEDSEISMIETLYPLLQGYDSVAVKADVELGGTDQKFNLLMGRRVQRHFGLPEQDIMTLALLEGTDGAKKMSKSVGNYIALGDSPSDMFGKIMAVPDALIPKYYTLLTDFDYPPNGEPYETKKALAKIIVTQYYSPIISKKTYDEWVRVFSKREKPQEMSELLISKEKAPQDIVGLFILAMGGSKSNALRQIQAGGVRLNDKVISNVKESMINLANGDILQIGKRHFFRIKVS